MSGKTPLAKLMARLPFTTNEDLCVLDGVPQVERSFAPSQVISEEGQVPSSALIVLKGMASAYHELADGSRQISGFMIPGDVSGIHAFLGQPLDHSVEAVTPVRVLVLENALVVDLLASHSRIARTLWWIVQQENVQLREHLTAIGRRDARARIAYLVCELQARYAAAGLCDVTGFHLSLTQTRVADYLGLTPVHVGRVLRQFHRDKLIRIERSAIIVLRIEILQSLAEFTGLAARALSLRQLPLLSPQPHADRTVPISAVGLRPGNGYDDSHATL